MQGATLYSSRAGSAYAEAKSLIDRSDLNIRLLDTCTVIRDDPVMTSPTIQETLLLIFQLSSGGAPSRGAVAAHLGCDLSIVDDRLARLRSQGWIHAQRVRLTMSGLVIASAAQAAHSRRAHHQIADVEGVAVSPFGRHRYRTPARRCTDGWASGACSAAHTSELGASLVRQAQAAHRRKDAKTEMSTPFQSVA